MSTPSRPVNMHANVALDISTTACASRGTRDVRGWWVCELEGVWIGLGESGEKWRER